MSQAFENAPYSDPNSNAQAASVIHLFDLRDVFRGVLRYRWNMLSVAVVVPLLALMACLAIKPSYQSTATMLIEARDQRPVQQAQDVYDPGYGSNEYYETQTAILRSRELARKVIERLELDQHEEFKQDETLQPTDWRQYLPFLPAEVKKAEKPELRRAHETERLLEIFSERLTIERQIQTQLVNIKFQAHSPELAAKVANELAEVFIESNLDARMSMARKATNWLSGRLDGVKADLANAEKALQKFREEEQLVSTAGGSKNVLQDELADNARQLRDARKVRTDLASAYEKLRRSGNTIDGLEQNSYLMQGKLVQDAKINLLAARQAVEALRSRYGPKHPKMLSALAALDVAQKAYSQQLQAAADALKADYEIATKTEQSLSSYEQGTRDQLRSLDRREYELGVLERNVKTNRELYELFLTRMKETDNAGSYQEVNARVVDPAMPATKPFSPKIGKILAIAVLLGAMLGVALALALYFLSDVVTSSQDLEALSGLSVLSALPIVPSRKTASGLVTQTKGAFAEGVRSIHTSLLLAEVDARRKRVLVTSSMPSEGKTTVAINLATMLGQLERVLLVDLDLRRPSVGKALGLNKRSGLIDLLMGTANLEGAIHRYEAGNIDVLPVAKAPPNPAELLVSDRFRELLEMLATRYDRIIFDTAPCQAVSDTRLLAPMADSVIFVVKAETTGRRVVMNALRGLQHARARILGAVVNQVDMKRHGKDYGGEYYGYRYYQ